MFTFQFFFILGGVGLFIQKMRNFGQIDEDADTVEGKKPKKVTWTKALILLLMLSLGIVWTHHTYTLIQLDQ